MLNALIDFSLKNRFVVLLLAASSSSWGPLGRAKLPLDAFPDTTPVQVQINTVAPELAPEEVERQITFPVEYALGGLKGLEEVRSVSKFGLSQVVAIFEDGTDIYFARQQINERLGEVQLPEGIERPTMGPVATGLGEVYHYLLTSRTPTYDLTELRTLQDWVIRPRLRRVPGVAEINAWGGLEKQFEVRADPAKLAKYGLTLDEVIAALEENNQNVGGGYVVRSGEASLVQGVGRAGTRRGDRRRSSSRRTDGVPIRVRDVAEVGVGHVIRRGGVTANGKGEVGPRASPSCGWARTPATSPMALDRAMEDVKQALPARRRRRRSSTSGPTWSTRCSKTVERNLFEGAVLVIAVLFAFLGNLRAGLIVASAIPLSMLFAVTMMERVGIAGSLMSLGAIDFGLVVDSSVVMVENCVRHLAHDRSDRSKLAIIRDAAVEVRKPTMFGELIIMIVYLPILTLEGVEGKLFRPMALTVIFALAGSMVLSLTLMPVLASLGLPRKTSREGDARRPPGPPALPAAPPARASITRCRRSSSSGAITVGDDHPGLRPRLGVRPPAQRGLDRHQHHPAGEREPGGVAPLRHPDRGASSRSEFPDEIEDIWSRTGTAEVATDPMGFELSDVFITLKPRERWKRAKTQEELVAAMAEATEGPPRHAGRLHASRSRCGSTRWSPGIRADLGIKLFGDDLEVAQGQGRRDRAGRQGASRGPPTSTTEQITGPPGAPDRGRQRGPLPLRRPGRRQVLDAIKAVGRHQRRRGHRARPAVPAGRPAARWRTATTRRPWRRSSSRPPPGSGSRSPGSPALEETTGPSTIQREWGERRIVVQANVRGRDIGSFVEEAQERIDREVKLPTGYTIEWGGQFENMQRAERRLYIVVPLALALILSLLYLTFHSLRDALMIFSGVLFARVGGVLGLCVMGLPFTISAGVGFVALAGASMLEGLILVSCHPRPHGPRRAEAGGHRAGAARHGSGPVLMTGTVAALGFVPMMLSTGIGAEVQRPLGDGRRLRHGVRHVPHDARPARPLPPLRQGPER